MKLQSSGQSSSQKENFFCNSKKPLKKIFNFSRGKLFCMKSKVCLKYFVHDCSPVLTHNYLFYLTTMWFSQSSELLIYFSLENLTSIIRTGQPVLVDLKGLINSTVTALSQMALLKQLTSQPTRILDIDFHCTAPLDLLISYLFLQYLLCSSFLSNGKF